MKRCPECRRDYYDDTLSFCLEDGSALVSGVPDEPATAILSADRLSNEKGTKTFDQIPANDKTSLDGTIRTASKSNSIVAGVVGIILVISARRRQLHVLRPRFK